MEQSTHRTSSVIKVPIPKPSLILATIGIVILYIMLYVVLLNKDLIIYELLSTTPLSTKLGVFFSLITGIGAMFSGIETILFSITVLLLSGNLVLFFSLLKRLRSLGTTSFTVGSSFIGFVVTGCASCQLTILSLATPLFSSTLVPLLGVRLQILSLILLVGSLLYNLKLSQKKLICKAS